MNQGISPCTTQARSRWLTLPAICALTVMLLTGPGLAHATTSWQFGEKSSNNPLSTYSFGDIFSDIRDIQEILKNEQQGSHGSLSIPPGIGYEHNSEDQHGWWRMDDKIAHVQLKFDGRIVEQLQGIIEQKENWRHGNYDGVVPIPASAWLFGSAIGLLGWSARRKKQLAAES